MGVFLLELKERMPVLGRIQFLVHNADGSLAEERTVANTSCAEGLTIFATAVAWSAIEDQNANMGSPFSSPYYLAPVYGAVGTSATAVTVNDSQLTAESAILTRQVCSSYGTTAASGSTGSMATFSFFFPIPGSSVVVAEAGMFLQATSTINSGFILDHALISPTVTVGTNQTATLNVTFTFSAT